MAINIRTKGASGEREIATILNEIIKEVLEVIGVPDINNPNYYVARNTLQSAIGGDDLTNTYGFSIEVKRQEALAINTWWKQCVKSASEKNKVPVLIYRQNRGKWKVITKTLLTTTCRRKARIVVAETALENFIEIFRDQVEMQLRGL